MPSNAEQLKQLMDNPPVQLDHKLPSFHPHVTVTTVPSSTPTAVLRDSIPVLSEPLDVIFDDVVVGDVYFRSVLVAVRSTPQLEALHAAVHEKLQKALGPPELRFPHLSLYYVDDAHASDRQVLLDSLWQQGFLERVENGVSFNFSSAERRAENENLSCFQAHEVWITLCEGLVEGWTVLEKIPLVR